MNLDPDPDSTEPMKPSFISWKEKRFGRNSIWWALFIHMASVYGMVVGGHWIAYALCGSTLAVIWIASLIDWRNFMKIDHKHPNNHYPDVCEGCDPIQMRDGGPVTNIVWWYAAHLMVSREKAQATLDGAEPVWKGYIHEAHAKYLAHPKFKNYPRP